ncbi:DnaD domain protein [Staphylococcus nepalensis]|uniref:DnaD domain protein n=1 Tax=Staphylococcus nepalensis TaxID=214473 RepID=UPI000BDF2E8C|nr:DnaD domain protein [Staphylococcus nepalensis]
MADSITSSITGYGLVFKRVMKDTNLSIEAKALYSYLSAYAGASETAFPSVKLMCYELNISEKRLQKYRKQLVDNGYLSISRTKSNNIYGKNVYTINHDSRQVRFGRIENGGVQNGSVETRPVENVGTTINSSTINSITNNSNTSNSCSSGQPSPFDFYQENGFGMLKPYVAEQISYWIDDFKEYGNEIVIEAMKESVNSNVTNWKYVNSILKSWYNDGVQTIEDIQARNNKRSYKSTGTDGQLKGQALKEAMQDPSYWD